jgi:hypothetical protein
VTTLEVSTVSTLFDAARKHKQAVHRLQQKNGLNALIGAIREIRGQRIFPVCRGPAHSLQSANLDFRTQQSRQKHSATLDGHIVLALQSNG